MGLKAVGEFSCEVGGLDGRNDTSGFDVVWLQKVEPVGFVVAGCLDL
jgi:hypothetical protein